MGIQEAIKSFYTEGNQARLEEVRRAPKGLILHFGVHKGQRGKRVDAWKITCQEVDEAMIHFGDQCGLAIYPSDHPAAREFTARQAEVRWSGISDQIKIVGALYEAHTAAVDDWIRFDPYSSVQTLSKNRLALRGPEFLMRAYAKALQSIGEKPQLILRRGKKKTIRPKVLHFGASHVVANSFTAERCPKKSGDSPEPEPGIGRKSKQKTAKTC
ncbi:MAG: hypothetical protein WAL75_27095 [Terracidiphilus sp.]